MVKVRSFCALCALTAAVVFAAPDAADACSFPAPGWEVVHLEDELKTAPDEPIVVLVQRYQNPYESPGPLTEQTFTVTLTGSEGVVPTGITVDEGVGENSGRVVVTPEEPLTVEATYTLTIAPDSEFPQETELPVVVVPELVEPIPTLSVHDATELQRQDAEACCQAASPDDSTCVMDSCGDFQNGEECRVCWTASYRYPIVLSLWWSLPDATEPHRYTHRIFRTDPDGEVIELIEEKTRGGQGGIQWPPDAEGPFCGRVEVDDVVAGTTSTSETLCVTSDDVTRLERGEPPVEEYVARCEAGTIETPQPVDDGENNTVGGPNPPGDDDVDGGSGKGEPGCCSTLQTQKPVSPFWLTGVALMLLGLRRRKQAALRQR